MGNPRPLSKTLKGKYGLEDCTECKNTVDRIELDYNACFTAYDNRRICNNCTKKIDK
jgi:hypothetical protein